MRRAVSGLLFVAFFAASGVVVRPGVVAAEDPAPDVAAGLAEFFAAIAQATAVDELGDTALPFTEILAGGPGGLDAATVLAGVAAGIGALVQPTPTDIETALDGLDGADLGGGITLHVDSSVDADSVSFATLGLTRDDVAVPLAYLSGDPSDPATFSLEGGQLGVDLALDFTANGPIELSLVGTDLQLPATVPTAELSAQIALDSASIATRLGILDVEATGSVTADVTFAIDWRDSDADGAVTEFELTNSAPADLFDVSIESGSTAAMDLAMSAGLEGLAGVSGTVTVAPFDLSSGELPSPVVTLNQLGDFTNMTPQDVLAAIAQLAISLRSMQLVVTNPDLPLIDENLAEFADWSDRITKLFVDNHLSLAENPIDLQIAPEEGVQCDNAADDDGDGAINEGCPGAPSDLEAKGLGSIEDIVAELATSLGFPGEDLGLAYAGNAVTFTIDLDDESFFQEPPSAGFNLADELAKAGVTSLQLGGGASITVDPSYDVHLTVGLDLSDALADPAEHPITDRVFVTPADGPELSFDAPVTGNVDLTGRIAMLELALADDQPGDVTLLGKRAGDSDPMAAIDLTDQSGDGRITLTEVFDGLSEVGVTTAADTFTIDAPAFDVVGSLNVAVPAVRLDATGSIGDTPLGTGFVEFGWADITTGAPSVTTGGAFDDDFLAFDIDPNDPQALFTTILTAIDTALGLVEDLSGDEIDREIPILGTSLSELTDWVDGVQDAVNALASDPAASLDLLELTIETAIADALDGLDGVDDFQVPAVPDPADPQYSPGGVFDLGLYEAAVAGYVGELEAFVAANGDFVSLDYLPGNSPGALVVNLDIGICSDKAAHPGCSFEFPITKTFNLDLSEIAGSDFGGVVDAAGQGTVALDYNVAAHVHLGVELPTVTPDDGDADSLPQVTGAARVFLADTSGVEASVRGSLDNAEFSATIGPFAVQVGETDVVSEQGAECTAGNTADEDGDGVVNDGCGALPNPETGAACDAGTAADDDGDGSANDGCPAVDAPEIDGSCAAANTDDEDGDGAVNDGCPTTGEPQAEPEGTCTDTTDDDGDGLVNDGCPGLGNPLVAKAGAAFSLANEGPTAGPGNDRFYLGGAGPQIGDFFTGITPQITKATGVDCPGDATPGTDDFMCAHLPIYADLGGTRTFLDNLDVTAPSFDLSDATITGGDNILTNLQAAGEAFAWDLIAQGIAEFGAAVDESLTAAAYDVEIPVIGDVLDAGADVGAKFNDNVTTPLSAFVGQLGGAQSFDAIETQLRDFFWNNIGGGQADPAKRFLLHYDDVTLPAVQDDVIVTLLCGPAPGEPCDTLNPDDTPKYTSLVSLRDVQVQVLIGQAAATTTPEFDWGVPGLRLEGDSTLSAQASWQISLGFGVSLSEGFYLLGDTEVNDAFGDRDISTSAAVDFGTANVDIDSAAPALEGDLAFLSAALWNAKADRTDPDDAGDDGREAHEVSIDLGIDFTSDTGHIGLAQLPQLLDPSEWEVGIGGYVDFYSTLATTAAVEGGASEGAIPRLLADIDLEWTFTGSLSDGLEAGDLAAGFENVRLDLGSFLSEFLGPVLSEVQRYTQPLQPIIDTLQAPIPGVSQLAELVGADPITLLDLMEAISGADLTLIRRLLEVVTFANAIPSTSPGDPNLIIPIGEFLLDSDQLLQPELPATAKAGLIQGSGTLDAGVSGPGGVFSSLKSKSGSSTFNNALDKSLSSEGGFSFPAFQDPSKLFNLLVGQDVELVEFDAGKLKAEVGWSQTFGPIAVGPVPVSVVVSIGAAVEGRFVIGYDTRGIRQLVQSLTDDSTANDGFFESVGTLLAGVYIGDLADDGSDPPEIRLTLEGAVGAAVDLVIIKAGIEAGLRATLDMNLHDGGFVNPVPPENLDGKLRIDEIITFLNNPLCLFDVSGRLEAFIRIFVTLDLFLFSVTYKQTIVNIVLLELENITAELCQPPEPEPASKDGSTLFLNIGDRAGIRNYDTGETNEKIVVRQLSDGVPAKIEVSYKGYSEVYDGISRIVGDGDGGSDTVVVEDGDISGVCQADGTVAPPVPSFDPAECPADGSRAGDTISHLVDFVVPLHLCGGPGADKLGGGDGDDRLIGDGELDEPNDTCSTGDDDDGADSDTFGAEGGNDDVWGNGGDDIVEGGSGDDEAWGGNGIDELVGGLGRDTLNGGPDADNLSGGPEADPCPNDDAEHRDTCSTVADDTLNGDGGDDAMEGGEGKDAMSGADGNDTLVGGNGDDDMSGGAHDDSLFGNDGYDAIDGDGGDDDAYGSAGDDTIGGGGDDDDLVGEAGDDTVNGDDGIDVILGDVGLVNRDPGAAGFTPSAGKQLVELTQSLVPPAGDDTLSGGADADLIYGQEADDDVAGDGGDDEIHGNAGADAVDGNAGADMIFGDDGADTIFGDAAAADGAADGIDTIRGGNDGDTISGNARGDRLHGDSGDDTIYGDADTEVCADDGDDFVVAGSGHDLAFGNSGDDDVFGEGGNDRLVGGSNTADVCDGDDDVSGGQEPDVIAGDNATIGAAANPDDMLVTLLLDGEGAGDHDLDGDAGDDAVFGQVGADRINGGIGNDYAEGNDGDDTVSGNDGDDDLVGGGSADDGVVDGDRVGNGLADVGETLIAGGAGEDWIAGDNALVNRNRATPDRAPFELFDVETTATGPFAGFGGGELSITGDGGEDWIFGQTGADVITGGGDADYVEGNHGDDSIAGDAGDDDLVGGGSADDGVIDAERVGDTLLDAGETLIAGGTGEDWITGDNALVNRNRPTGAAFPIRLFDVETTAVGPLAGTGGGELSITGDDGPDWIFGQTGGDVITAGAGADYAEGNNGDDTIHGDASDDDLVGGGSADDGVIDAERVGDTLLDVGENVVTGDAGEDWITGDNALVNRNRPTPGRAPIELFDVATAGGAVISPLTSGGDLLQGNDDADRIFGQGNGAQPAGQTDPLDGRNNDFVGTPEGDLEFDRITGTPDEDGAHNAGWLGDTVLGGAGDDEIEGNHGNDVLLGNAGADDIAGGGSADDGEIWDDQRAGLGAALLDGADVVHGDDPPSLVPEEDPAEPGFAADRVGDDDVAVGDNGWIDRTGETITGTDSDGLAVDLAARSVAMTHARPAATTFGDDFVAGNGGHDELYGQAGDDALEGGWGSDALVGDLGAVTTELLDGDNELCGAPVFLQPNEPFVGENVCVTGTLFRRVELFAFDDTDAATVADGDDVVLGGDGADWMHGGAGSDMLQGDGDGGAEFQAEPPLEYTSDVADPNTASADNDRVFGGDSQGRGTVDPETGGNGDALWGGRGRDHLFGGNGDDMLDVRNDDLFPAAWSAWAEADVESYHGIDVAYGGYDQDALQANVAANGPVEGDRMLDWAGVYNLTHLCPASYGAYVTIRGQSPSLINWVLDLADADGAVDAATDGTSGDSEVAMVYKPDVKFNSNPTYPGTPGHKNCGPDFTP